MRSGWLVGWISSITIASMRPPCTTLTPTELEIMKIVWQAEPVTVRDVYEPLRQRRRVAYTTVLSMMRVLLRKGYVTVSREARAHAYRSVHSERQMTVWMAEEFVSRVFEGHAFAFLVHLLEDNHLGKFDVTELRERITARRLRTPEPRRARMKVGCEQSVNNWAPNTG